jgi:hypothetical protein
MNGSNIRSDRNGGFLQKNERGYLVEKGNYPIAASDDLPNGERRAKGRIKNEVVPPDALGHIILQFDLDLLAVWNFQRSSDREAWKNWRQRTLPTVKQDLENLRNTLDRLIEIAEDDELNNESEELHDALSVLGIDPYRGISSGVLDLRNPEQNEATESPEIKALERYWEVQDSLTTVLGQKGAPEILEYVKENGPCQLRSRRSEGDGQYWTQVANESLVPGLLETDEEQIGDTQYKLTDLGRDVLEVWMALKGTTGVEKERKANPEKVDREHVKDLLMMHRLLDLSED